MCPVLILTVAFWLMFGARQLVFALHIHLPLAANQSQLVTTDQSTVTVPFVITKLPRFTSKQANRYHLQIKVADEEVARFDGPNDSNDPTRSIWFDQAALNRDLHQLHPDAIYESTFGLKGQRVGFTHVQLRLLRLDSRTDQVLSTAESNAVDVLVTRPQQNRWSTIFTIAVIILVNLNNINMGCALDMAAIKQTLARPVAPLIGLCSQYVFMPLLAFAIGAILLPDVPYLRFGLFVFGCSPGGSASNMWSVLLKGNLNLSITMTLISTFTAMAMMPAWLFTLGRFAFNQPGLHVPYRNIVGTLASMSFCLAIGLSIQRYFPKLAQVCRRILAPLSGILIGVIVVFATFVYWYLFRLMTWQVLLAAATNVWCGFLIGTVFAFVCRRSRPDLIAIAVETGIQNTGVTFAIIRLALDSPFEDFAMTIPVAASIMSCLPLVALYVYMSCIGSTGNDRKSESKQKVYSLDGSEVQPACVTEAGDLTSDTDIDPKTVSFDESKLNGSAHILSLFTAPHSIKSPALPNV